MLTDRQVVLMRQKLMKGKTQQAAAAASDMSERSVRNWNKGPLPSEKKDRRRKSTRPDPFAGVWAEEVEPLLEADVAGYSQRRLFSSGWTSVIPDGSTHRTCGRCSDVYGTGAR